jgi:hypothetical protein
MATDSTSVGSDLRELSAELITTLGGIVTSLLTVGLNLLSIHFMDRDVLSTSAWFVIPIGAMGGGMAAASGYYIAARITQTQPTRKVYWNMLLVGASTWALAKWLPYVTLRFEDGRAVSELVSFWEFINHSATSTKLTIGGSPTRALGSMGYVREVVQLLGFALGGRLMFGNLREVETCRHCRRYARAETLLKAVSAERFEAVLRGAGIDAPSYSEALQAAARPGAEVRITLVALRCPQCSRQWVRPAMTVITGPQQEPRTRKLGAHFVDADAMTALERQAAAKPSAGGAQAA